MSLSDEVAKILEVELLKKQILEYFMKIYTTYNPKSGVTNEKVNPIYVVNLPYDVPALSDIVEIVPYVKEINTSNGEIWVGWNLFVDGIYRLDLGSTKFENFDNLMLSLQQGNTGYVKKFDSIYFVEDVLNFIMKTILEHNVEIDTNSKPIRKTFYNQVGEEFLKSIGSPGTMGRMYTQNRMAN